MNLVRQIVVSSCFALLAANAPVAYAEARHAAMVIDANTGQVLHAQAADDPRYPASLTKMMTLYMAFELIDAGRLTYSSKIKISQEAASAAPSKLDLDPGEEITAIDAIKALVTKSANDIAIAMAEHIGGTEANFARLMTARARQIGMKNTTFRNASGLPDPGQTTTARDMLTLALKLQDDFPRHYGLFATRSFSFNGSSHRNHNTLLGSFAGTDGIKTGYTRASGFNLVSSVRRDGRHIVAAVFGGASAASRNAQMRSLLSRSLGRASKEKTRKPLLIAKPRLAPRPSQVATTAPKPTPPKRAEIQIAEAKTVATPQPVTAPAPIMQPVAAPVAEAPAAHRIDIAKVRRVMVAPRMRASPAAQTDSTEEPSADTTELATPRAAYAVAPAANAPARADETILAKAMSRRQMVDTSQRPEPPLLPPATIAVPAEPPAAMVPAYATASGIAPAVNQGFDAEPGLGRAPSTLQQQAISISSGRETAPQVVAVASPAAPSYRLQGPPRAPVAIAPAARLTTVSTGAQGQGVRGAPVASQASTAQGFQIQVGAYATSVEAERQLASIKSRASTLLQARTTLALPVRKGDRQLFRARFAGFDANGAASTCLELRRLGVDCFVMRAE